MDFDPDIQAKLDELTDDYFGESKKTPARPGATNSTRRAFGFTAVGDLEYSPPEFLVADLIETDTLGEIFGDPGCGKSFIAVDIAACVATGTPFHGRPVKQGTTFYIAGEGHSGLVRRWAAWSKANGVPLKGSPLFKSDRAAHFLDTPSIIEVRHAVHLLAKQHGDPNLIVIDTLSRNFGGGDENSTSDMAAFVAAVDDLKAEFPGCAVVIVHHTGHADKQRARGSIVLMAALDCEYRVTKNGPIVRLSNTKMKDAEPPDDIVFALESVDLGNGASSAVLVERDNDQDREHTLTKAQVLARETYVAAVVEKGRFGGDGFAGLHLDDWRCEFYARHTADNEEAKRKAFQRVRTDLQGLGLLDVADDVYRWADPALILRIAMSRGGSGTSGTCPGQTAECPDAEAVDSGTCGTLSIDMSQVSRTDWVDDKNEKADCPCSATITESGGRQLRWPVGGRAERWILAIMRR